MTGNKDYGTIYIATNFPWTGSFEVEIESDLIPAGANAWDWYLRICAEDDGGAPDLEIEATSVTSSTGKLTLTFAASAEDTEDLQPGRLIVDLVGESSDNIYPIPEARGYIQCRHLSGR